MSYCIEVYKYKYIYKYIPTYVWAFLSMWPTKVQQLHIKEKDSFARTEQSPRIFI